MGGLGFGGVKKGGFGVSGGQKRGIWGLWGGWGEKKGGIGVSVVVGGLWGGVFNLFSPPPPALHVPGRLLLFQLPLWAAQHPLLVR